MNMASLIEKFTSVLWTEEDAQEKEAPVQKAEKEPAERRVPSLAGRPVLTVHTNKMPELKVAVCAPTSFEQANRIANALKNKEAVIVNYEKVDACEQRRLCDFINGVCYVLDGGVQRISETSVLYVPVHVNIDKELLSYSVPPYVKE